MVPESKVHLVIPDSHAHPDFNNDRFSWLGKFIVDLKPDVIVNLGDQADMPSLCSYDKGTKGFEGRRYKKDIESNRQANELLFAPLREYNAQQRKTKHKTYNPRTVFCVGNHENRINRAINHDPAMLDGVISLKDLGNEKYWKEIVPFLDAVIVDGICYSHYFVGGLMGRPIGGVNQARAMITKAGMSCTAGHSHTRDFAEFTRPDGARVQGLVAGVYQDYHADFAGPANHMWWRGVVVKRNVNNGAYDHQWVSIEEIKQKYS